MNSNKCSSILSLRGIAQSESNGTSLFIKIKNQNANPIYLQWKLIRGKYHFLKKTLQALKNQLFWTQAT